MSSSIIFLAILYLFLKDALIIDADSESEDKDSVEDPHRAPSLCEVCKYLTMELKGRLVETGKTKEVLETGYSLDKKKKRKEYRKSELRLIEAVNDPHVCDKIMEYQVHAERKGSLRFAKGRSETMQTLHNLVDKGVKVELGIPFEMWDTPSAGVSEMQRQCFKIVEDFEDRIEEWYYNHQDKDLTNFLCRDAVLKQDDKECLEEVWSGKKDKGETSDKPPKKTKKGKDNSKLMGDSGEDATTGKKSTKHNDEL